MNLTIKAIQFNGVTFPNGCQKDICCPIKVNGTLWRTPVLDTSSGEVIDYSYTKKTNNTPPQADSMAIVRFTDSCGNRVDALIADNETAAVITDACAICCGDTPPSFTTAIKAPIQEVKLCADSTGAKKLAVAYKASGALVMAATFNSAAPSPAVLGSYANAGALVTWVLANWGAYVTACTNDATNRIITFTLHSSVNTTGIVLT